MHQTTPRQVSTPHYSTEPVTPRTPTTPHYTSPPPTHKNLVQAIGHRDWPLAITLIKHPAASSNFFTRKDSDGRNLLHKACSRGAPLEVITLIIASRSSTTNLAPSPRSSNNNTSSTTNPTTITDNLIMARDKNGLTPLHWAVSSATDENVINIIVDACPGVTKVKDDVGRTPYDLAVMRRKPRSILRLLQDAVQISKLQSKGSAALVAGNTIESIRHYTTCLEMYGASRKLYASRSAAYLTGGDVSKALEDAERCIELYPNYAEGYMRKGSAFHCHGMYEHAIAVFQKGLNLFPSDGDLQFGLAESLREASRSTRSTRSTRSISHVSDGILPPLNTHHQLTNPFAAGQLDQSTNSDINDFTAIADLHAANESLKQSHEDEMSKTHSEMAAMKTRHEKIINDMRREAEETQRKLESDHQVEMEKLTYRLSEREHRLKREHAAEVQSLRSALTSVNEARASEDDDHNTRCQMERNTNTSAIEDLTSQLTVLQHKYISLKVEKEKSERRWAEKLESKSRQIEKLRSEIEDMGEEKDAMALELNDALAMNTTTTTTLPKTGTTKENEKEWERETMLGQAEAVMGLHQTLVDALREQKGSINKRLSMETAPTVTSSIASINGDDNTNKTDDDSESSYDDPPLRPTFNFSNARSAFRLTKPQATIPTTPSTTTTTTHHGSSTSSGEEEVNNTATIRVPSPSIRLSTARVPLQQRPMPQQQPSPSAFNHHYSKSSSQCGGDSGNDYHGGDCGSVVTIKSGKVRILS